MKRILLSLIFTCLILSGCRLSNRVRNNFSHINGKSLKALVEKAISGDSLSNNNLNNLIDLRLPVNNNFILFNIDSVKTAGGKKYYLVLLNNSNPVYNRFAVYDSLLKCYLIDKSLNGYLYESVLDFDNTKYVKLTENFNSKDVLTLNRISLYMMDDDSVTLAFRDFTKLIENGVIYTQTITKITSGFIGTEINSTDASAISNKQDVFYYNDESKRFISSAATFYNFVKKKVSDFKFNFQRPEIIGKNSILASINSNLFLDSIKTTSNTKDIQGFSLTLTDNWETLRNRIIPEYLRKTGKGTIFLNKVLGSSIYVIVIPKKDSAEMFIKRRLTKSVSGKYKIRFSDKITAGNYFVQYFEYSCGFKKFLLILKTSQNTYSKDRKIYQAIINSFKIDC